MDRSFHNGQTLRFVLGEPAANCDIRLENQRSDSAPQGGERRIQADPLQDRFGERTGIEYPKQDDIIILLWKLIRFQRRHHLSCCNRRRGIQKQVHLLLPKKRSEQQRGGGAVRRFDSEAARCRSDESLSLIFVKQRDAPEKPDNLSGRLENPANSGGCMTFKNRGILPPQPLPVFRGVRALSMTRSKRADALTIRELRFSHRGGGVDPRRQSCVAPCGLARLRKPPGTNSSQDRLCEPVFEGHHANCASFFTENARPHSLRRRAGCSRHGDRLPEAPCPPQPRSIREPRANTRTAIGPEEGDPRAAK